jgi:hypothetical protein
MLARHLAMSLLLAAAIWLFAPSTGQAQLVTSFEWTGPGNWSIDAGNTTTPMSVVVPTGSTVERAFLYVSTALGAAAPAGVTPVVVLSGTTYGPMHFTPLRFSPFPAPNATNGMQAYRADVTAQVRAVVGSGSNGGFSFSVNAHSTSLGQVNGETLVVVYSNPNERPRQIALLDGGMPTNGGAFSYALGRPLDTSITGFTAQLSLGIGFSTGIGDQVTRVSVNGRPLTAGAGGGDDGGSITVGGIGDLWHNPLNPLAADPDDELYELAVGNGFDPQPFLRPGITAINFTTVNPGGDDHLFFAGLNIAVPEPSAFLLVGAAALGFLLRGTPAAVARRRNRPA